MANVIRDLVIKVTVDADTKGFDDMNQAQEETSTASVALGNVIADMTTKLLETAIAAAKAGAAMAVDLVFGTTAAADAVAKTSKQLGVQAEQLQRLSGAAELSGAEMKDLEKGVRSLTNGLADAQLTGSGPVAEGLKTLGLGVEDVSGLLQSGDIEGALGLIGDAFNETEDSALRSAALMKVFGAKAGAELRPLLEQGSEGIGELGDQIKNVITDEDLAKFEELADQQFLLEDQTTALKNELAKGLAPAAGEVIDRISKFVEENEELITQDLPAFLGAVGDALVDVTEFTIETVESWREFIIEIDNAIERFQQDFPAAVGFVTDALALVDQVATDVGDAIDRVVDRIFEAVEGVEALSGAVATVKAGLGLDDEPRVERGAGAQFDAGGTNITSTAMLSPENSSEDLQGIVDGNFAPADKAIAQQSLGIAKNREAVQAQQAEAEAVFAAAEAAAAQSEVQGKRSANRAKAARGRGRKGGGGGGGSRAKTEAEETSIDDLIGSAIGAATGGPDRVGASALSGTMLVNVDNSINITNGPVTVEVGGGSTGATSPGDFAVLVADEVIAQQRSMLVRANDHAEARALVGPG